MPFDPNGLFEAISSAISKFPPALFAAALLGGPTALWLILRFASPQDPRRREEVAVQELLWVCGGCRSINDDRLIRCYSCHRLRLADLIPVASEAWAENAAYEWGEEEPDGWEESPPEEWDEDALEVGIPVGPGLPAGRPAASSWLGAEVDGAQDPTDDGEQPDRETQVEAEAEPELEPELELDVAVGSDVTPRGFEPVVLEPRLRASARAPLSEPRPEPRSGPRPEPRSTPRSGLRSTQRSAPRGRWTDLPPPDLPQADPPQETDEDDPKRSMRRRRSAGS
jgi:hypothetical protein